MSGAPGAPASGGQWSDATKLAIAGALLSPPGGPGGFTASLGKGLTVGAEMTERERQLQEAAALRRALLQETQEWHRQTSGARQTSADASALRAQAYAAWTSAKTDMAANPANYKVTGQVDQDGHPLVLNYRTGALIPNMDVTAGVNPNVAARVAVGQENADTNRQRASDQSAAAQQRIDQAMLRIQNTEDYRQATLKLRQRGLDDATINNTMTNAARLSAMTPGLPVGKAADQVLASRSKITPAPAQTATPASPSASDPLAAARAAISRGAPRDAVIQRLRDNGINPAGL